MDEIIAKNKIDYSRSKSYYWEHNGKNESILHLGKMKKAVVIRKSFKNQYFISEASYFPFESGAYHMRFDDKNDATKYALLYIGKWLQETLNVVW